jgi:hypothetical protein
VAPLNTGSIPYSIVPAQTDELTVPVLSYPGDIVYVNLAGVPVIVINSFSAAQELAVKRNRIYSARTAKPMTAKL